MTMITILFILWAVIVAWSAASVISSMMSLELFWGTLVTSISSVPNSLYPAGRIQMFYFHPSNEDIASMMFYTLPLVGLVNMLLSMHTHVGKSLLIITWLVSLVVIEEIFFIELIRPDLFVAAIVLSVIHLLVFLRVATIVGLCFKFAFRLVSQIIFFLIYLIMAPLALKMTVDVSIGIVHMIAANSNLPTFGLLLVVAGSSLAVSYATIMALYNIGNRFCHAAASYCVHLPIDDAAADLDYLAQLPPQNAVSWADDGRHVSNRLYYRTHLLIFSRLFTGHERKRLKNHVKLFRHVMDELLGLVSGVCSVPDQEDSRCDYRRISKNADVNYNIHWIAQGAVESVNQVYNGVKEDHPLLSWSNYSKLLNECKLFEQTIDCIFLEIKLRTEFSNTPLWRAVQNSWHEGAFDHAEAIEEADAILVLVEEEAGEAAVDFGQIDADVGEEEEEEVLPQPNVRRRSGKSEAEKLNSELGSYWEMIPRRSGRTRRSPDWFIP